MFPVDEIDNLGNTVKVNHSKLDFSPAYSFFLRQQAKLVDSNQCAPCTYWEDSTSEILWVEFNNNIVASSCFTTKFINHPTFPLIYTHSTFVNPQYRRRGIQKILFKHFQNLAKEYKCKAISQTIGINNVARLAGTKKDGLTALTSIFVKDAIIDTAVNQHISIDLDPVSKPIFDEFKKEKQKVKKHLMDLGHSETVAYALTEFDDHSLGIACIDNDIISFDQKEIKKGNLQIYTASSYAHIDALAIQLNCSRIVIKLSIKDSIGAEQLKDYNFDHKFFVLYKLINKKD
jgi:GNAT superfamily N-acetyltransferase